MTTRLDHVLIRFHPDGKIGVAAYDVLTYDVGGESRDGPQQAARPVAPAELAAILAVEQSDLLAALSLAQASEAAAVKTAREAEERATAALKERDQIMRANNALSARWQEAVDALAAARAPG